MAPWAPQSRGTYPPAAALEHKRSALFVKSENENNTSHVDNSDDTEEKCEEFLLSISPYGWRVISDIRIN